VPGENAGPATCCPAGLAKISSLDGASPVGLSACEVTQTAFQAPQQQGVPVVGGALDGPEWGQQPNTNMVSVNGDQPAYLPGYSYLGNVAKQAGATNIATLAIQGIPSSVIDNQTAAKAFEQAGVKVGYVEDSLPLGTVDVGPIVLAMKNSKVNGFYSTMLDNTNFAIMTAAAQSGLKLKAGIMAVGYGQALLDDQSAVQAGQGAILTSQQVPVEEKTATTVAEQTALQQYGGITGVPDLNITDSWLSADLIVAGLEKAGQNPTRASFLNALHNTTDWTAGGLLPQPPDLSLADFGKAPQRRCGYFVRLEGKQFVPMNGGKPFCGTAVP
jgi:Periplasmic binding protein